MGFSNPPSSFCKTSFVNNPFTKTLQYKKNYIDNCCCHNTFNCVEINSIFTDHHATYLHNLLENFLDRCSGKTINIATIIQEPFTMSRYIIPRTFSKTPVNQRNLSTAQLIPQIWPWVGRCKQKLRRAKFLLRDREHVLCCQMTV